MCADELDGDRLADLFDIDEGFAFLGMKIMRRTKGTRRYVYTFVGDEAFASIKRKVKALTGRSTTNLSLSELLRRLTRSCGVGLATSATPPPRTRSPTQARSRAEPAIAAAAPAPLQVHGRGD